MTKKKAFIPVKKKAAPKKKSGKTITYVHDPKAKMEWKQTGEAHIPGLGTVKQFNVSLERPIEPPAGETRISELELENKLLYEKLRDIQNHYDKKQSDPLPQIQGPLPQRATMLSQLAEQLDSQLSRLYNSLNILDTLSNRLLIQKEDGVKGTAPEAHDFSIRFSNLLTYFSIQNDRLDFLNTKLSDLI